MAAPTGQVLYRNFQAREELFPGGLCVALWKHFYGRNSYYVSPRGGEYRLTQAGGLTPVSEDSVKGSTVLKVLR